MSNISGVYRSFVDLSAEEVDILKGLTTCDQGSVEEYVSTQAEVVEIFARIANTAREGVRLIRAPLQPGPIARELVPPSVEGLFFKGGSSDLEKRCALRFPHTLECDGESETYQVFVQLQFPIKRAHLSSYMIRTKTKETILKVLKVHGYNMARTCHTYMVSKISVQSAFHVAYTRRYCMLLSTFSRECGQSPVTIAEEEKFLFFAIMWYAHFGTVLNTWNSRFGIRRR